MNFDHPNRKILVTGKSGSGKTTLWIKLILGWRAKWVFVFDPERQFARKTGNLVARDVAGLNYALATGKFIVYDPTTMFPGDREQGFAFFCRWVLTQCRHLKGVKVLAVDEVQSFQSPGPGGLPQSFKELGDEGRREEVDFILCAQALNDVNHKIRRQINRVIVLQHTEPNALEILKKMGVPTEQVPKLPSFSYLDCDLDRSSILKFDAKGKPSAAADSTGRETGNRRHRPGDQRADRGLSPSERQT